MAGREGDNPEDLEARTAGQSRKSSEILAGDYTSLCRQRQDKGTSAIIWTLKNGD